MSHHEGVSCDSCLKANFRGKRYKCLVCFDYDLCAQCYEQGATSSRHSADHAMQCILTRADSDLYYGGETVTVDTPQAFTCPFCSKMGFTESLLQEHVNAEHMDSTQEVVCPICASIPAGEPNNVTDDFATHLHTVHVHEEPQSAIRGRRAPHPTRSMNTTRARRSQMQYQSSGLSALSPSSRDSMDPIAELLSQLSGVRRAANLGGGSAHSQLQNLQIQLDRASLSNGGLISNVAANGSASAPTLTRQPFADPRAPIERVIRRHQQSTSATSQANGQMQMPYVVLMEPNSAANAAAAAVAGAVHAQVTNTIGATFATGFAQQAASRYLLSRCNETNTTETEQQALEVQKADRSIFLSELLLVTLSNLSLNEKAADDDPPFSNEA